MHGLQSPQRRRLKAAASVVEEAAGAHSMPELSQFSIAHAASCQCRAKCMLHAASSGFIQSLCHCAQGRWYITAGLNPLFDTFDCQEHYFGVPEDGEYALRLVRQACLRS